MDFLISSAYAQTAGAAQAPGLLPNVLLFGGLMVAMYFFMLRPQMKRAKEQRTMIEALGKGDEVISNGGIAGRITDIGETFITLEISSGVSVKLQKGAISMVLPKGTLKSA
ncbi:MAG: preprotein translocase subunit YajC [Rudaea sp.]